MTLLATAHDYNCGRLRKIDSELASNPRRSCPLLVLVHLAGGGGSAGRNRVHDRAGVGEGSCSVLCERQKSSGADEDYDEHCDGILDECGSIFVLLKPLKGFLDKLHSTSPVSIYHWSASPLRPESEESRRPVVRLRYLLLLRIVQTDEEFALWLYDFSRGPRMLSLRVHKYTLLPIVESR